jgi:hypothetical protein
MDASRFDSLARALSHSRSRRSIARLLGALAFGGGVSTQTARGCAGRHAHRGVTVPARRAM